MAVAARADHPAIDAQLAADPPQSRALRLSVPEDTLESSNNAASAVAEATAMGVGTTEESPQYRWTNSPPAIKRKRRDHGRRIVTPAGAAPPHALMPAGAAPTCAGDSVRRTRPSPVA